MAHFCCQTALQSHTSLLGTLQAAGTLAGGLGVYPSGGRWGDSKSFRRKWGLSLLWPLGGDDNLEGVRLPPTAQRRPPALSQAQLRPPAPYYALGTYLPGHDFSLRNIIAWTVFSGGLQPAGLNTWNSGYEFHSLEVSGPNRFSLYYSIDNADWSTC